MSQSAQSALALASSLTIGSVVIRELDGLFSLNDLHQAAGNAEKHRPNQFLRIDQTRALIAEIENAQICAFRAQRGSNGGTYACRELVIAYAAWISAAFHLKVIRVFLESTKQQEAQSELPGITECTPELALSVLEKTRWFFTVQNGQPVMIPIEPEAFIVRHDQIADIIQRRERGVPLRFMPEILAAVTGRLVASGAFSEAASLLKDSRNG